MPRVPQRAPPPTTDAARDCTQGGQTGCLLIAWPGMQTNAAHSWGGEQPDIRVWYRGLVDGMRDASGQMYMRNRYYDPATGQFTQTDPIGLAGGLNAYGFAAGDPVSYSDPYGLCVWPPRPQECARRAGRFIRGFWDAITLDVSVGLKVEVTIGTPIIGAHASAFAGPQLSIGIPIAAQSTSEIEVQSTEVKDAGFGLGGNLLGASGGLECKLASDCGLVGELPGHDITSGSRTLFNDPGISGKVQALLGVGVKLNTAKLREAAAQLTTESKQ